MLGLIGVELFVNGYAILLIPFNTCFKNNRGIGKLLNTVYSWLPVLRTVNLIILSYVLFSFHGNVCFCDGRHYFLDHCQFTNPITYDCNPLKNHTAPGKPSDV